MGDAKRSFSFEITGIAKGKGRPRFRSAGKFVQTYTDKQTLTWENYVRMCYLCDGGEKLDGNIRVSVCSYFPIPKSVSKKKHAQMVGAPFPHKPDCDNIAKSILDALNGIAFDDDRQVVCLTVYKFYADSARTVVQLEELGG